MLAIASTPTLLALSIALAFAPAADIDAEPSGPEATEASDSAAAPAEPAAPARRDELDPFSEWKLRLGAAIDATNEDPGTGAAGLQQALREAPDFPLELANDDAARNERNFGQLTLSRALLTLGQDAAAAAAMDNAIRDAGNDPLNVERFGPSLADLHRQRVAGLEGQGRGAIKVECRTPCRVYVNEHPAPAHAAGLFLGRYRVLIASSDGSLAPLDAELELTAENREARLAYPVGSDAEGPDDGAMTLPAPAEAGKDRKKKRVRALPRWLEVTSIVGGAAAAGAGVLLLRMDAHCVGDLSVKPTAEMPGTCSDIYKTRIGAFSAIGAGAFFFAGGIITLSVDESRVRRARGKEPGPADRTVTLGYTRRF